MTELFNVCEGVWWLALASYLALRCRKGPARERRVSRSAAALSVLFGISDFIEVRTGAWWRPWPLFVLKAVCVCGLVICGILALRWRKPPADESTSRADRT